MAKAYHKSQKNRIVCVVGQGYVGLPLAVAFANKYKVIGYDTNNLRVEQLRQGVDVTGEFEKVEAPNLTFTSNIKDIAEACTYVITVPTPIDKHKVPDLGHLIDASNQIAKNLDYGDLVIFESTVYPGATRDVCIPLLEKGSGLKLNIDFHVGYSPERINPGDKTKTIDDITKVTSGSDAKALQMVDNLYRSVIAAGTHPVQNIETAEAAKVIENIQRDVNIALINEFAIIFDKLGLNTRQVLEACATKWNFLNFNPGLVGGHCIGVDPYYLTYKCQEIDHNPEVILAGRRTNDGMGEHVANKLVKTLIEKNLRLPSAKVLILGLTFKENCPDIRNTGVAKIISQLNRFIPEVDCFDPLVEAHTAANLGQINFVESLEEQYYDAVIVAVAHDAFKAMGAVQIRKVLKPGGVLFDVKSILDITESDLAL